MPDEPGQTPPGAARKTRSVIVCHSSYGCESGCCGHIVKVNGETVGSFQFDHPFGEDFRAFAEGLIRAECGDDHVADLDWDNCEVIDD